MNVSRSMDPLGVYKEQARRLEAFLAAGGHKLKHSHALQAIALIHGFDDFHLLRHAAGGRAEPWLVATYGGGVLPHYQLTDSLQDGIGAFLAQVARVACNVNAEMTIRAQSQSEHRGLYAMTYGSPVCSLTQPQRVAVSPNEHAPLPFDETMDLASVANEIQWAIYERDGWEAFMEQVHDEQFLATYESRLEDRAMLGASVPSESPVPLERIDAVVEAAHRLVVAPIGTTRGGHRS